MMRHHNLQAQAAMAKYIFHAWAMEVAEQPHHICRSWWLHSSGRRGLNVAAGRRSSSCSVLLYASSSLVPRWTSRKPN